MKRLFTILIALLITAFMAASVSLKAETIISAQDGNWKDGTTWVGGVVPTNADSVVVHHAVNIYDGDICLHLYVAPAGIVQNKINASRDLEILGNLYIDGTMQYTNNYFRIYLGGNIHLNGVWDSPYVHLTGTNQQVVTASPGKVFNSSRSGIKFVDDNPASSVLFSSDLTFRNIELNFAGAVVEFAPSILISVYTRPFRLANITGNYSEFMLRDGAYVSDVAMENLTLKGSFTVYANTSCTGEIVIADTLQNRLNISATLDVNGNFTNDGVIRITNNHFNFDFAGNVTNNGEWTCRNIEFDGAGDQSIAGSPGKYIYCTLFSFLDNTNKIILTTDFEIRNAAINLYEGEMIANGHTLSLRNGARFLNGILENARLGGVFQVDNPQTTFRGTTYVDDTLQNYTENSQQTVLVDGDLVIDGVIRRSNYYGINLSITGDIENNSYIETNQLRFVGPADQIISGTAKGNEFEVDDIFDDDPASAIIVNSDILFTNSFIDLQGATIALNNGNLSMLGGNLENGAVEGYDHYIKQNNNARFLGMSLSNLELRGICQVRGPANYFNNVTVTDTLQNYSTYSITNLYTTGNFINNGVITFTNSYKISFKVEGNFYNYGYATLKSLEFTGAGNQEFSSDVLPILNTPFASSKTGGSVLAVDDVLLEGCNVNLNWDVLDLQDADIIMTGGKLADINIDGNGNKLIVDGDGVAENVGFDELFLEGKLYMKGQNNTFENVTITDTISRQANLYQYVYITTTANFINNGHITNDGSYGIYFYVNNAVINNGDWYSKGLIFIGADMHYIESQNASPFEVENITNPAKGGDVEILSDLYLLNTTIDFDDVGLHLPAAGILNLDNSTINQVTVMCGDFATINCMNNSLIGNSTIDGAIISGTVDVATNTFIDCVIDGLVQNHDVYATYTLNFEGDLTNNGIMINRPSWGYHLYNNVYGNVYNYGTWETEKSRWEGLLDQDIYLMDESQINTPSEFHAMLGTGGYQWYKNDEAMVGETSNKLDFTAITVADRGYYYCETNEGASRTLRICTVIDIDLANEAYFCQYESVMIEATALTGDGPYTYSWEPVEGLSDPTISNPLANPTEPTVYFVTITDAIGCEGESSIFVQQYPQLFASAGNDTEICYGFSTTLSGSAWGGEPDYTFEWSPVTGLNNPNIANPIASPISTTFYILTVTDANGCAETSDVNVIVNPLPEAYAFDKDSTHFCYGTYNIICQMLNSETGIDYHLLVNGLPNGEIIPGTGDPLDIWATTTIEGHYTVRGENTSTGCENMMIGSVMIYIDYPPEVIGQSGDEVLIVGENTTLWVDVTSTQPPEFKWFKDGLEIPGATSYQYQLDDVTLDDAGLYYCEITNNCDVIQSEPVTITVLTRQTVEIPAGWSGFSTYQDVYYSDLPDMFDQMTGNLVIVNDFDNIYWPSGGINTYTGWDSKVGSQIKVLESVSFNVDGLMLENLTVDMDAGWYYLPVLDHCPVAAADIFGQINSQLDIAKDIAGTRVYWPDYGITTLNTLDPGLAYLIKLNAPGVIQYSNCLKAEVPQSNALRQANTSPWANPVYSATSHTIAFPKVIVSNVLLPGDRLGVFNTDGICCGIIEYDGSSTAITAFGDDPTTNQTDGLAENEWMNFRAYRPVTGEMFVLIPEFDASAGETGLFAGNGLSVISYLKSEATGICGETSSSIKVYPNPSAGLIFIEGISAGTQIEISDATGQVIHRATASGKHSINLGSKAAGLYSIRITCKKYTIIRKVMVE